MIFSNEMIFPNEIFFEKLFYESTVRHRRSPSYLFAHLQSSPSRNILNPDNRFARGIRSWYSLVVFARVLLSDILEYSKLI